MHHFHWRRLATTFAVAAVAGGSLFGSTLPVSAAGPTISGFSPTVGPVGTLVTITGSGFTGATAVTFGSVAASFTQPSDTQVNATVPSGATTGPITVDTPSGNVTSTGTFTVGQVFDVTTYGAHGDSTGDNHAAFAAAIAAAQTAGAGSIVWVPAGTYWFVIAQPASIQIGGTVPIVLAGAGRDTTTLVQTTFNKDLLSVHCDGTTVQDLTLNTQTFNGGHGLGDGGNHTLVQHMRVVTGTNTFGIYYPGPPGAHPGNNMHSESNVVNDLILNDWFHGDGWSFSFQDNASISNVQHTGSRITLYADTFTTVTNYFYTPGTHGGTAGFVMSTPCANLTITNFVTSGQGGQIKTAPDQARVNQNITINGEQMTGGPKFRLLIGDVQNLLIENSSLDTITIAPKIIAQGTVQSSTYTSVVHRAEKGALDEITFS